MLSDDDVTTLKQSILRKEDRKGAKLYKHMVYLTVDRKYLKLIAQYNGKQL